MKTKLEMAHEIAVAMQSQEPITDMKLLSALAWQYADAMQAEADKRENEEQEKLEQDERNYHDELVFIGLEEWQPDWSQAPDWANFLVMSCKGTSYWHSNEPRPSGAGWVDGGHCDLAHLDYYCSAGNWRESLRKRPE